MDARAARSVAAAAMILTTGCSTANQPVDAMTATAAPPEASSTASADPASDRGVSLIAVGFGQDGQYLAPIAIVKNNTQEVGQFVTVNFNLLDSSGRILVSTDQVEQITWAGQELLLPGWADLDSTKTKVARIDATIAVSEPSSFTRPPPKYTAGPVKVSKDDFGGYEGWFEVMNPTAGKLIDLRIGVACYNKTGDIIGGTAVYPELVPANGKIKATTTNLTVSGKPHTCKAFPGGLGY